MDRKRKTAGRNEEEPQPPPQKKRTKGEVTVTKRFGSPKSSKAMNDPETLGSLPVGRSAYSIRGGRRGMSVIKSSSVPCNFLSSLWSFLDFAFYCRSAKKRQEAVPCKFNIEYSCWPLPLL